MTLSQYATQLSSLGTAGQEAFLRVAQAISAAEMPLRRSSAALDKLWITMKNTMRWQLTSGMLHGFIGAVQTAYGYTQDLNKSLNSIRIVTGQSVQQMDQFAEKANKAAQTLSTTTTRYTDAALIYYQQGLTDEEVEGRTNVTIKLANVAAEAAEEASQQLTAVWNNFYDGTKSLEYYADVMTALGATTATSTQEISQGLQKFAAVADTVGLSYEYAAAALATVTATTRESADIVGTAFRTLFGRLESLKLGETLDDGTTLNKYSKALKSVGVDVKDVNGELKDMDDILTETMDKWGTLTRDQQMALAQTVAGVRQYAQFIALMDNADFFRVNLETARNAEGALQEQADVYAESWEAARDRVKAAAQEIYTSLIDDDVFISIADGATTILHRIDNLVDSFGGLGGTLNNVFLIATQLYGDRIASGINNQVYNLKQSLGLNDEITNALKRQVAAHMEVVNVARNDRDESAAARDAQNQAFVTAEEAYQNLRSKTSELSEQQQGYFKLQVEGINRARDAIGDYITKLDEAANETEKLRLQIIRGRDSSNSFAFGQAWAGLSQSGREYISGVSGVQGITTSQAGGFIVDQEFGSQATVAALTNAYLELQKQVAQTEQQISEITSIADKAGAETTEQTGEIDRLNGTMGELHTHMGQIEQVLTVLRPGLDISDILAKIADNETVVAENSANVAHELEAVKNGANNLKTSLEDAGNQAADFGQKVVQVSQGLSSVVMGWNALRSLGRAFSDEDMSAADRFTTILMSLSMLLGTVRTQMSLITQTTAGVTIATTAMNVATGKANVTEGTSLFQKTANVVASKQYAAALAKQKGAIDEVTKAQIASNAAMAGSLVALAEFLVIAGLIVGTVYLLTKAYNRDADAAKAAAEAHEKAAKSATQAKQAYQDLLSTIEGYNSAVAAIKDLTVGTDEYKEAVEKANEKARELLDTNKALRSLMHYENGLITFEDGALSNLTSSALSRVNNAQIASYISEQQSAFAAQTAARTAASREAGFSTISHSEQLRFQQLLDDYAENGRALTKDWEDYYQRQIEALRWSEGKSERVAEALDKYYQALDDSTNTLNYTNQEIARTILSGSSGFAALAQNEQDAVAYLVGQQFNDNSIGNYSDNIYKEIVRSLRDKNTSDDAMEELIKEFAEIRGYQYGTQKNNFLRTGMSFLDSSGERTEVISNDDIARVVAYNRAIEALAEDMGASADDVAKFVDELSSIGEKIGGQTGSKALIDALTGPGGIATLSPRMKAALKESFDSGELQQLFEEEGIADYEAYSAKIEAGLKSGNTAWENAVEERFEGMAKAASHALETLATSKELLDEDEIRSLSAAFSEFFDFGNLGNVSGMDQVLSVTKALSTIATEDGIDALIDARKELLKNDEALDRQIDKYNRTAKTAEAYGREGVAAENRIQAARLKSEKLSDSAREKLEDEIEELEHMKLEPIVLDVEIRDSAINALSNTFKKAAKLIEKDYKVTFDNVAELAKLVPEAFEGAVADVSGGFVQLNKAILDTIDDIALAEIGLTKAEYQQELEGLIAIAQTTQGTLHALYDTVRNESADTAIAAVNNEATTVEQIGQLSKAMMLGKIKDFLTVGTEDENTTKKQVQNANTVGKAGEEQSTRYANAWRQGYENVVTNSAKAASAQRNNVQAATDTSVSIITNAALNKWQSTTAAGSSDTTVYTGLKTAGDYDLLNRFLESHGNVSELKLDEDQMNQLASQMSEALGREISTGDIFKIDDAVLKLANEDQRDYYIGVLKETLGDSVADAISDGMDANADWLGTLFSRMASLNGIDLTNREKESASKSTKQPKDKTYERYHEITREIEKQSALLSELDEQIDRTYGTKRLDLYKKALEELNKQAENYLSKATEAEGYLAGDRAELDKFNTRFGLGLIFGDTGEITNYSKFIKELTERRNDQLGITDNDYTEIMNAIKRYEEALDTQRENLEKMRDTYREIEDEKLNELNYRFELVLDVKELKKQLTGMARSIAESYGDALTHTLDTSKFRGVAILNAEDAQTEINMLGEYTQRYDELRQRMAEANEYTNTDDIVSAMKDLVGEIEGSIDSLLEWVEYWENMVPDAIDAARERFEQFTNQLEHNTTVLDSIKELYALQGQTYKTAQGFDRLQRTSAAKMDAQLTTAVLNRDWYERAKRDLLDAQNLLDSLDGDETDIRWDTFKNNRDALLQEFNEAEEAYLASAKDAMETAKDMYVEQLERAAYVFGQTLANSGDLSFLTEKYDHYIEKEERYLDAVNTAYEKQSWLTRIQKDIDESTNKVYQERLKLFYQQEVEQRALNGLNEYDLDILEAKYKVLQAQMALEDAQNAKNNLRLVRDRQGNWNYQFTANPDEIADAEQNLADAQNEWYNIAKAQVKDVTGEIIATWKEAQDAVQEVYNDMTLTDQERADKATEIYDYYCQKITDLEREKQISIADMTEAGELVIEDFQNVYANELEEMSTSNEDFSIALEDYMNQCKDNMTDYQDTVHTVAVESSTDLDNLDKKLGEVETANDKLREAGQKTVDQLWSSIDAIYSASNAYADLALQVEAAYQAMLKLAQVQGADIIGYNGSQSSGISYDPNVDYSALMTQDMARGDMSSYNQHYLQREAKMNDMSDTSNLLTNAQLNTLLETAKTNEKVAEMISGKYYTQDLLSELRKAGLIAFASGGYTGDWGANADGKLAVLHEKELVLNQADTSNILAAVEAIRSIERGLDNNTAMALGSLIMKVGGQIPPAAISESGGTTNQFSVYFPNVTNHTEIEEAIRNLENDASQFVRIRES